MIILPEPPDDALGLTPWLHNLTGSTLPGLLKQADPQHVIEFSLALITVLNEVGAATKVPCLTHPCLLSQHLFWQPCQAFDLVPFLWGPGNPLLCLKQHLAEGLVNRRDSPLTTSHLLPPAV